MRKSLTIILSNNLKIEKMQRINFEKQKKQLTFPFIEKKGLNLAKKYSSLSNEDFMKLKTGKSNRKSKKSLIEEEYVPFKNKNLHEHHHENHKLPHIHSHDCDPFVSAYDLERWTRYYFTNDKTPVRCYIKYEYVEKNEKHDTELNRETPINNNLFHVSKEFVKETENLVFIEKTRSFIPNNEFDKNDNHIARKKQQHANKIKKK